MNKYKKREFFDDQVRYYFLFNFILNRDKPSISKNSLVIAKKIREQIADQKMTYCEFRKKSTERKKCEKGIKSEDQIGGQAFHVIHSERSNKNK